ncbi:MAG: hypothetical protein WC343_11795 [Bacilli bacterium]|jgi:hypothetical protein
MRRAAFGALIGENRLLRTYDSLGWSTWGWTEPIGGILYPDLLPPAEEVPEYDSWEDVLGGLPDPDPDIEVIEYSSWDDVPDIFGESEPDLDTEVLEYYSPITGIREVIATFGENVIALAEMSGVRDAIYHSPNSGKTWTKVLEAAEIYDITSVGYNWTLASTSNGWYSSLTSGSTWELVAPAGAGVPVGISVVWVMPNHLFCHTGSEIWLSEDRAATWEMVCDLTAIEGYLANNKFHSIDGYQGRVIATCGYSLIETLDLGSTWDIIDLSAVVRAWNYIGPDQPIWRQVAFWDTLDSLDPTKSQWMFSTILTRWDIIRTFVARGDGRISPVVDMALSERHRLNVSVARRAGADITDTALMITGDRRIDGELRHALTISQDGIIFDDVLGGAVNSLGRPSNTVMDMANATLAQMVM